MKGFFVTGTDTGVGKTEVAAYLVRFFLKKGYKVGVMKPVATGVEKICEDAAMLSKASTTKAPVDYINPISLKPPLAPLVASRIQKKKIDMGNVWDRFKKLIRSNDMIIVEGIGGVLVPLYKKKRKTYYVLDMILRMRLPVIIVARPNLGTINHTLMTVAILKDKKVKIEGIIFDHASPIIKEDISVRSNPSIIEELSGVRVLGIMQYNKDRTKRRMTWLRKIG